MRKTLITGANGFIGSNLIPILLNNGDKVIAFSVEEPKYKIINDNIEYVIGDIRNEGLLLELLKDINVIYHLAALADVTLSYRDPNLYIDVNTVGTLSVCKASLESEVERLIVVSSAAVYGEPYY